ASTAAVTLSRKEHEKSTVSEKAGAFNLGSMAAASKKKNALMVRKMKMSLIFSKALLLRCLSRRKVSRKRFHILNYGV
ncbi:MAG: hypothetical protein L6245_03350, partial [Thermodesulfovibrionales bacterium]|nr:hypothetical protein [Thermodesulfovibrionales bacterium]